MIIQRTIFFLVLSVFFVLLISSGKVIWFLRSEKTTGVFSFEGRGNALEQIRITNSFIYFRHGKDTVWFNGPAGLNVPEGAAIPVRYNPANPSDAKVNTFFGIWGGTVVYCSLPLLVLLVLVVHPHIIPYRSVILLSRKRPFMQLRLKDAAGNPFQ